MADRYLRLPNPNPGEITDQMWWLMLEILRVTPQARNGGILARKPGYHSSVEYNLSLGKVFGPGGDQWNYSIRDATDLRGNRKVSRGVDITFNDAQSGNYETIALHMRRMIASGKDPNDHRLDNWREVYGNADFDREVEGYDFRHERDVTSDLSHLWHCHGSCGTEFTEDWPTMDAFLSVWVGESNQAWRDRNNMAGQYGGYGAPGQKFVNDPMNRSDSPDIFTADVWGQEMHSKSPFNGVPSPRTVAIESTRAGVVILLKTAAEINAKVSVPVPVTLTPEQYDGLSRDIHAWVIEATTAALLPISDRLNLVMDALGRAGDATGTLNDR